MQVGEPEETNPPLEGLVTEGAAVTCRSTTTVSKRQVAQTCETWTEQTPLSSLASPVAVHVVSQSSMPHQLTPSVRAATVQQPSLIRTKCTSISQQQQCAPMRANQLIRCQRETIKPLPAASRSIAITALPREVASMSAAATRHATLRVSSRSNQCVCVLRHNFSACSLMMQHHWLRKRGLRMRAASTSAVRSRRWDCLLHPPPQSPPRRHT